MVDRKKIQEAAQGYCDEMLETFGYVDTSVIDAFTKGVSWAINQFKKSLWHDAEEEPKDGSSFVYINGKGEVLSYKNYYADNFDVLFHRGWLAAIGRLGVTKWCYLSDILPKGGEQ